MKKMPDQESPFTSDGACCLEFIRNPARCRAAFQKNKSLTTGCDRREHGPGKPPCEGDPGQQQNCQKFAQVSSILDELLGFPVNRWWVNRGKYPVPLNLRSTIRI